MQLVLLAPRLPAAVPQRHMAVNPLQLESLSSGCAAQASGTTACDFKEASAASEKKGSQILLREYASHLNYESLPRLLEVSTKSVIAAACKIIFQRKNFSRLFFFPATLAFPFLDLINLKVFLPSRGSAKWKKGGKKKREKERGVCYSFIFFGEGLGRGQRQTKRYRRLQLRFQSCALGNGSAQPFRRPRVLTDERAPTVLHPQSQRRHAWRSGACFEAPKY